MVVIQFTQWGVGSKIFISLWIILSTHPVHIQYVFVQIVLAQSEGGT